MTGARYCVSVLILERFTPTRVSYRLSDRTPGDGSISKQPVSSLRFDSSQQTGGERTWHFGI